MTSFSARMGIEPPKAAFQIGSMDDNLRVGLWNSVMSVLMKDLSRDGYTSYFVPGTDTRQLLRGLWMEVLHLPIDEMDYRWEPVHKVLKQYFFKAPWNKVYDFVQFCVLRHPFQGFRNDIAVQATFVMNREMAGYTFVDDLISPITDEIEVAAITLASQPSDKFSGPTAHIRKALEHLSNRDNPDYPNSIKESISAVEAMASIVAGHDKAELGKALAILERERDLHGALKSAFGSLYGYTSDEDGIRHAIMEKDNVIFDDAKFMLVACSAFVNYLKPLAP